MSSRRGVLGESRIHHAVEGQVVDFHRDVVEEVDRAVAERDVVVVGMAVNPHVKRARRILERAGVSCEYLEYGSYVSGWRRRLALKMWTGWPTFPMVFVRGRLVGGASDLAALVESGELGRLLAADRAG